MEQIVDLDGAAFCFVTAVPATRASSSTKLNLTTCGWKPWPIGLTSAVSSARIPGCLRPAPFGGPFAVNCGVVGKPDHDGDTAVHYALIDLPRGGDATVEIRRVAYDQEAWARTMETAGIAPIFIEPVRTGIWTTGVASLPPSERFRWLRASATAGKKSKAETDWRPEFLECVCLAAHVTGFPRDEFGD